MKRLLIIFLLVVLVSGLVIATAGVPRHGPPDCPPGVVCVCRMHHACYIVPVLLNEPYTVR